MNTDKVTRVELIRNGKRERALVGVEVQDILLQDDERTLKIFVRDVTGRYKQDSGWLPSQWHREGPQA